ncbi:Alpha-D-ribose 1-methylphosphonate 5-triphosphate synthase subunit PhnG [compost metagenome]
MNDRQRRQRVFALTPRATLERHWQALALDCPHTALRAPEIGLAMLRGRIGGNGQAFNLGEITMVRASVALADGTLGHGYVAGRDRRHAELIALLDACAQKPEWAPRIERELLQPLEAELAARHAEASRKAAATRVDFFTLLRGD